MTAPTVPESGLRAGGFLAAGPFSAASVRAAWPPAATLFGQATPAAATVAAGCCNLCFSPTHSVAQCETGQYYVWSCPYGSQYLYCNCCEHGASGDNCNHVTYSSYSCQY